MRSKSASALFRGALLASLLPLAASAQNQSQSSAAVSPAPRKEAQSPAQPSERFSIKFPGGTLAEFAAFAGTDVVSKQGVFNLMVQPEAASLPVPPFEVRNTDAPTLAAALANVLARQGNTFVREVTDYRGQGSWIFVAGIERERNDANPGNTPIAYPFVVASLLKPIGPYEIQDVVGAIRTAAELSPNKGTPELTLKYHEPSRLLFVSGPQSKVAYVDKIIQELKATAAVLKEQR